MKKMCLFLLFTLLLAACTDVAPIPVSESDQQFSTATKDGEWVGIPVDDGVYSITGHVVTMQSLVRQTSAAHGSMYGTPYGMSGTYFGPELDGKGLVRVQVTASDSRLAPKGSTVILKVTDTKAIALLPGDTVKFKCRHQYEAIAAVRTKETFDAEKLETWELDYCRLVTPSIGQ